jgi:hypothetical protein
MTLGLARALVYLKRIAAALDRAYPPPPAMPRRRLRPDFSVATVADFDRGYDSRAQVPPDPEDVAPRPFKEVPLP